MASNCVAYKQKPAYLLIADFANIDILVISVLGAILTIHASIIDRYLSFISCFAFLDAFSAKSHWFWSWQGDAVTCS